MKLSIVATLYQSAPYIQEFCRRASDSARKLVGDDFELILVNDGSPDASLEVALEALPSNPNLVVVDLSKNFGHHKAMMTGLEHARGAKVFLIDSDLEEEPEWLLDFDRRMLQEKCDMVYGVQEQRKGGLFERWSGQWFWNLFNFMAGLNLTANMVTARLMSRRFVDSLLQFREREVFFHGLAYITGFKQVPHSIKKHESSETTYTLRRKMALLINSITAFSNAPLVGIFYIGTFISVFSFVYIIFLVLKWSTGLPVSGWTSTIASIWLIGGMNISFMGVLGIYLSKIFLETKQRPLAIVRQVIRNHPES